MRHLPCIILLALTGCIVDTEFTHDDAAQPDAQPDATVLDQGGVGGGGDGGQGGEGGQGGGPGGAGGDGGQGGEGGGETGCARECARAGACAVTHCDGIDAGGEVAFVEDCVAVCAENPALAAVVAGQATCAGLIDTLRAISPEFGSTCAGTPDPLEDTAPLGRVSDAGPDARLIGLDMPSNAAQAVELGCTVAGAPRGSALSSFLSLMGDEGLSDRVRPDADGGIAMLVFARLAEWRPGQTGNEVEGAELEWLPGVQDGDAFRIQRAAYVGDHPDNGAVSRIAVDLRGARLRTRSVGSVVVGLPLASGTDLQVPLVGAQIDGALRVDDVSFAIDGGVLQGYLTRAGMARMVGGIYERCDTDDPPTICEQLRGVAPTADDAVVLLESLIGFDVLFAADRGEECEADCNAVGVCFSVEFAGATVTGVER